MPGTNTAPTFVASGKLTTAFGLGTDEANGISVLADGKFLVTGSSVTSTGPGGAVKDFALARYNADGTLDASFGTGGKLTTAFTALDNVANAVTVQPDGKILVAGWSQEGSVYKFALARYNANGSLDTTFSSDGKVVTAIGGSVDYATSMKLQSDGKILLAGASSNGADYDFALIRYNSDGTLDTSFDGDGKLTTSITSTSSDTAEGLAVQSDGSIVVVGASHIDDNNFFNDVSVVRYNSDGSLDITFSGDGKLHTSFSQADFGSAILLQSDGKIVVAGTRGGNADSGFVLARFEADGDLDPSFGTGGKVSTLFATDEQPVSAALQSDGKIIVAGTKWSGAFSGLSDFVIVRYNDDGTLDQDFGNAGIVTLDFAGNADDAFSVSVSADGKIIVAGRTRNEGGTETYFGIARFNSDGSRDSTFAPVNTLDGAAIYTPGGPAVVLDANVAIYDAELSAGGNYAGATLTLARVGGANAEDTFVASSGLSALNEGGALVLNGTIIGTVTQNSGGTLALTFDANGTRFRVNEALRRIAYTNSSGTPPATVEIGWTFSDGNSGGQGTGGALSATGSSMVSLPGQTKTGTAGADTLTGTANSDTLQGLAGNDTLIGLGAGDVLDGGAGIDTASYASATSSVSVDLAVGKGMLGDAKGDSYISIENVTGSAHADTILGDGGANSLTGGGGDDFLDGGSDSASTIVDKLIGGLGDDTYIIRDAKDLLTEATGQGTDAAIAHVTAKLAVNVENLTLAATAGAISGTGNAQDNLLIGNAAANTLDGGAGNDTIMGIAGDDILKGGSGLDTVSYADAAAGVAINLSVLTPQDDGDGSKDTLSGFEAIIGSAHVDTLTGDKIANVIEGGADGDTLEGGLGLDTLSYAGSNSGVIATLNGTSTATVSGGDADGDIATGFENVTGSDKSDQLTGDSGANVLTGRAGNDTLDGKGGIDTLVGGADDDTYILDQAADKVVESAGEGLDTVRIGTSYTLTANVENLELQGTGDWSGTGNDAQNTITGTSGRNTLDGGVGADTLMGGAGDDSYIVDNSNDTVTELLDEGVDTVLASASFVLADHVEHLTLTGTAAIDGKGNGLANTITGNSAANVIEGGASGDTLDGGGGLDTLSYAGSALGVTVALMGQMSAAVASGGDANGDTAQGFENLLGSAQTDVLMGDAGKNTLDGGDDSVNDTLTGGLGDDVYVLRGTWQDQVVEVAGQGKDTVWSYMTAAELAANVDNGVVKANGGALSGNGLANILTGSDGSDTLDGGTDDLATIVDQLKGGKGDDIYVIRDVKDKITESKGEGADTVRTELLAYTLGMSLENLTFTGAGAHNGTGNATDNKMVGGDGSDTLKGLDGNDTLEGDLGADVLIGGNGADKLTGGDDADIFVLDGKIVNGVFDEIMDFDVGDGDMISLKKSVFTGLGGTDNRMLAASELFLTANFLLDQTGLTADHRIIYDTATGQLFYDKDGSGSAAAVQIAALDGTPTLAAGTAGQIMIGIAP